MGDEAHAKLHAEAFEVLIKDWLLARDIPFLAESVRTWLIFVCMYVCMYVCM